jgi:protein-disulfide isomerase-like protein with CxxC motif
MGSSQNPIVVWYFTDPACPWGYSSRPVIARLRWRFGDQLEWRLVLIGLTETTEPYEQASLTPARIASLMPGFQRRFGMPFATVVKSRLAPSSRACRAVVAARQQDPDLGYAALQALQLMQFTTARLLDHDDDLRWALEAVDGLDPEATVGRIDEPAILDAYDADRAHARSADGTPSHAQGRHASSDGGIRYTAPSLRVMHSNGRQLEIGGFQAFDAYDTALANLEPGLVRRPPPEDAAAAVREFPAGVTTAEVASVMRASDLDEGDLEATRQGLIAAVDEGSVACVPAGGDALWLPRAR